MSVLYAYTLENRISSLENFFNKAMERESNLRPVSIL